MISTKTVSVVVAKESSEVFECLEKLLLAIKAKQPIAQIVAGNLSELMTAVEGFEEIAAEVKSVEFYETAALGGAKLTRALIGSKED